MLRFSLLSIHTDMFSDLLQFQNFKYHPHSQNLYPIAWTFYTRLLPSTLESDNPISIRNLHSDRQLNIVRTECLIFPIIHKH